MHDLCLGVPPGERFGLLGPNGAGDLHTFLPIDNIHYAVCLASPASSAALFLLSHFVQPLLQSSERSGQEEFPPCLAPHSLLLLCACKARPAEILSCPLLYKTFHVRAGKTTTLALLTGRALASGGDALVNGVSVMGDGDGAGRALLGFCPQQDPLLELLTAREHLSLYARLKARP